MLNRKVCLARTAAAPRAAMEYRRRPWRYVDDLQIEASSGERMVEMSRLVKVIRSQHERNQTRRELNRAIANATTPAMRDELILVAQRGGNVF
jgi:hypothetical protein